MNASSLIHPIRDKSVPKSKVSILKEQLKSKYRFGFMFVRDPFARALSAYYNKVRKENYFEGKKWTPNDYFSYLVHNTTDNQHFNQQVDVCDPCYLNINFIGRTETMYRDMDLLINKKTKINQKVNFILPKTEGNISVLKKTRYKSMSEIYYNLNKVLIRQFIWKYRFDYLAFGYNPYSVLNKLY